jgi:hypothetical protein
MSMSENELALPDDPIVRRIHVIRGRRVIVDADIAALYRESLLQAVRRNRPRFPSDFAFQLTAKEHAVLRSQLVTSKRKDGRGGRRYRPYVFTEQGVAMLASVLRSPRAIRTNIAIVRTFVRIRHLLATHVELAQRLDALERRCDANFEEIDETLRQLMAEPDDWAAREKVRSHAGAKSAKRRAYARDELQRRCARLTGVPDGCRLKSGYTEAVVMQRRAVSSCAAAFAVCAWSLTAAAEDFVVLDNTGTRITIVDSDAGVVVPDRPLVAIGDDLILALERSPHDGVVYALGKERLYRVDVPTASLSPVGPPFGYEPFGSTAGVGFDALGETAVARVIRYDPQSAANQPVGGAFAYGLELETGRNLGKLMITAPDGTKRSAVYTYVPGDPGEGLLPALRDLASTTGTAGAFASTRFAVDVNRHTLVRLGDAGGLAAAADDEFAVTTIGNLDGLREDATPNGIEIAADGSAYLLVTSPFHLEDLGQDLPDGTVLLFHGPLPTPSGIYRVDLATGASERIQPLTYGTFRDFALSSDVRVAPPLKLSVTRATMHFDFHFARNDSVRIEGSLPFDGTGLKGQKITVVVGGDLLEFTLDRKGRGRSGRHSIRVDARRSPSSPSYVLTLRGRSKLHDLVDVQNGAASDGAFTAPIEAYLRGVAATDSIDVSYRKRGHVCKATLAQ